MNDLTAVIMAAGKGTRLQPLTQTVPKSMVRVNGKSSLERNLDQLEGKVKKVVLVVSYLKNYIQDYLGENYKGMELVYVDQKEPKGTAHALYVTKDKIKTSEILVLNGDDIYSEELFNKILATKSSAIIGKKVENWQNYGVLASDENENLVNIVEKPSKFVGDICNIGFYKVQRGIFKYYDQVELSPRNEYEITDLLNIYSGKNPIKVLGTNKGWYPLSYAWDLLNFVEQELGSIQNDINGQIEDGAVVKGNIILGENSIIKSGAYLEGDFYIGKDCIIGPNCYLKGYGSFDDGVVVGNSVEITRSIIGKNSKIKHLSYVGDSVIGNNVNIGASTIISNLRHDKDNIRVKIDDKLIDTGRYKFGSIIGDNVKTGINTTLYPGSVIDEGQITSPSEIVKYIK